MRLDASLSLSLQTTSLSAQSSPTRPRFTASSASLPCLRPLSLGSLTVYPGCALSGAIHVGSRPSLTLSTFLLGRFVFFARRLTSSTIDHSRRLRFVSRVARSTLRSRHDFPIIRPFRLPICNPFFAAVAARHRHRPRPARIEPTSRHGTSVGRRPVSGERWK